MAVLDLIPSLSRLKLNESYTRRNARISKKGNRRVPKAEAYEQYDRIRTESSRRN